MSIIDQHIKDGQFNNIYLLYGDEDYLKNQYASKLIKYVAGSKDSMNYSHYEDNNIDMEDLINTANTLPFFADNRIVHIKNSGLIKKANAQFNEYLDAPSEGTVLIIQEASIDKRSKAYKTINKSGVVIECKKPDANYIMKWIGGKLNAEQKSMEKEAYREFVSRTDSSMDNMDHEFEKLICFVGDRDVITLDDVKTICTKQLNLRVFDMINAIAEKDPKKVLNIYHDLLASKEPPIKILVLIQRQFNRSLMIKDLRDEGLSSERIAQDLNISKAYFVDKELRLTRQFSIETMNKLLAEACELEQDIKTGRIKDQMAVELLIMKYSH